MSREIYLVAKKLLSEGCSVVPIAKGKKAPTIKWEVYQRRLPTERELYQWFIGTDNQLGLITGNVSGGRFIVDFDGIISEEAFQEFRTRFPEFENGRTVVTGSGKPHIHGRCPDFPVDFTRKLKHYYDDENQQIGEVELRGNRHQSLVPPSIHPCGTAYDYVDENDPVVEISRERFQEIVDWMDEGQRENAPPIPESENLEADELTPEQKSKLADYYLTRILRQVRISKLNRNDKGYELARSLNDLKLPFDEAKSLMKKYAEKAPDWEHLDGREPYTEGEAFASLRSAYQNKPETPWIPWGFREEFEREREKEEIKEQLRIQAEVSEPTDKPPPQPSFLEPPDVFRGTIKKIADLYSRHLESPYAYWSINAATYLGNLFCQRVRLNSALQVEPRIFMSGIGPSAEARKSESQRQMDKFFREWQDVYLGREEREYQNGAEEVERVTLINTCHVGSAEGLISFLKKKPNSIYVLDELRSFVQKSDIKGSNLLQVVNTLFESNGYENITKDSHLKVENAHLSFLGFSTIDTWETMFSSTFADMGFINRLWIVPGKSDKRVSLPESIPRDEKYLLFGEITRTYQNFSGEEPVILEMDWDARERWDEWYNSYERNEYTKRLDTYGLRFMQIMCISENKREITPDIVERVISLLEWQKNVREKFYPVSYGTKEAECEGKIMKVLRDKKRMEKRDLYRAIHGERYGGKGTYNKVLKTLADDLDIIIVPEKTGKRPKEVVKLLED